MSKNGVKIRKEPGVFTHLAPEKITHIRQAAKAAVKCLSRKDIQSYEKIIDSANSVLTKHERGIFNGFAIVESENATR